MMLKCERIPISSEGAIPPSSPVGSASAEMGPSARLKASWNRPSGSARSLPLTAGCPSQHQNFSTYEASAAHGRQVTYIDASQHERYRWSRETAWRPAQARFWFKWERTKSKKFSKSQGAPEPALSAVEGFR